MLQPRPANIELPTRTPSAILSKHTDKILVDELLVSVLLNHLSPDGVDELELRVVDVLASIFFLVRGPVEESHGAFGTLLAPVSAGFCRMTGFGWLAGTAGYDSFLFEVIRILDDVVGGSSIVLCNCTSDAS